MKYFDGNKEISLDEYQKALYGDCDCRMIVETWHLDKEVTHPNTYA